MFTQLFKNIVYQCFIWPALNPTLKQYSKLYSKAIIKKIKKHNVIFFLKFKYLFDVVNTEQPPTSRKCSEDLHLAVLSFGEALVLAALTCGTHLWVTLVQQHTVDAL